MLNKIHKILRDPECSGNIRCVVLAIVIVIGMLALLTSGFAWLSFCYETIQPYETRVRVMERNVEKTERYTSALLKVMFDHKEKDMHYGRIKSGTVPKTSSNYWRLKSVYDSMLRGNVHLFNKDP